MACNDRENPHHVCAVCGMTIPADILTAYYWNYNALPWWATCSEDHFQILQTQTGKP
jgi:hypothetical protein